MQFFLSLAKFFLGLYVKTAGLKKEKKFYKFVRYVFELMQKRLVFLDLPKGQVRTRAPYSGCSELAIVVQGPIVYEQNFTFESIKSYKKLFPGATIVLSTWSGLDPDNVNLFESLGVHVLENEKPEVSGPMNVNLQLHSTIQGIKKAKLLGSTYVLKTRTDTRLYGANIWGYLKGLLKLFPPVDCQKQESRIVVVDYATRLYVPYHLSDVLMFGHIEDMFAYWSVPMSDLKPLTRKDCHKLKNIGKEQIPEVYFCKSYVEKKLGIFFGGVADWWVGLGKYFIVVDRSALGFFWYKYPESNENFLEHERDATAYAVVNFRDWIVFVSSADDIRTLRCELREDCLTTDFVNFDY